MKKITLLLVFMLIGFNNYAQQAFGFLVEENWINTCDAGTLTLEDFAGGPSELIACGPEVSSIGNNCYPEGALQEGFSITIENEADVSYYPINSIGNNEAVVAPCCFDLFTVINFSRPNITRVGLNLFSDTVPEGVIRVFDINGVLFETLDINIPGADSVFFGIFASVSIGRLELETASGSGYSVANLRYGNCNDTCTSEVFFPEGNFPFNIEIDPGDTSTADCENAPNLIPVTVNRAGIIGQDATLTSIFFDIEHTFTADLELSLISPAGTELLIVADQGNGVDNGYNGTSFADDADDITEATAPYGDTATFSPQGGRFDTTFFGESITGDWMIKICDDAGGDTGQVVNAGIFFCAQEEVNPPANDLIENAFDIDELGGFPYTDPTINFPDATDDTVINTNGCDIATTGSVWYKFTTTDAGTIIASFEDTTNNDNKSIIFYTAANENATLDDLTFVNSGTNTCGFNIELSFEAEANQTYYALAQASTSIQTIIIDGSVLSTEESSIEGFSFFPNPVENVLNISATQSADQITLFNITGQKVLEQEINATNTQLSVSNLPSGIYLMTVTSGNKRSTYKIIKK